MTETNSAAMEAGTQRQREEVVQRPRQKPVTKPAAKPGSKPAKASMKTRGTFVPKGPSTPGQQPLAVVNKQGHVLPCPSDPLARLSFVHMDVTYIYDPEDLRVVIEQNERALREDLADRILYGSHTAPAPEFPEGVNAREVQDVVFRAEMLED